VSDFAARIHAVIDTLDDAQKQQLLRLLIEDVRVTGWHIQIRLRIALDPPPQHPTDPTAPTGPPPPHPKRVSTKDGLRSVDDEFVGRLGLTPDGGHLTGGTAGPAGRMSVCRASEGSTPRSFGSRLPAW
jgi:hypothetical protein